jgi:hypothetical protein
VTACEATASAPRRNSTAFHSLTAQAEASTVSPLPLVASPAPLPPALRITLPDIIPPQAGTRHTPTTCITHCRTTPLLLRCTLLLRPCLTPAIPIPSQRLTTPTSTTSTSSQLPLQLLAPALQLQQLRTQLLTLPLSLLLRCCARLRLLLRGSKPLLQLAPHSPSLFQRHVSLRSTGPSALQRRLQLGQLCTATAATAAVLLLLLLLLL